MVMDGIIRPPAPAAAVNVVVVNDDDLTGDGMQCSNHRYRNNASGGGICAVCLQEKLGKLVSSSSTSLFNPGPTPSSSSTPPPLRSDPSSASAAALSLSLSLSLRPSTTTAASQVHTRRPRIIPFLKKKKVTAELPSNLVLKRSRSAAAPRRNPTGFWSFLYHSKPKPDKTSSSASASASSSSDLKPPPPPPPQAIPSVSKRAAEYIVVVDESVDSPNSASSNATSFGRKVSRSRSVGCGSRSFSGDFFERISTGFGDCTLRRVESQREGRPRCSSSDAIKEKVRCGGIFSGFMVTSSSSSSYWLHEDHHQHHQQQQHGVNGGRVDVHARSRRWGWALASPMRAFRKPPSPTLSSTRDVKASGKSNATPNLAAIPSLLTARG